MSYSCYESDYRNQEQYVYLRDMALKKAQQQLTQNEIPKTQVTNEDADIEIIVESGYMGGNWKVGREWHGKVVTTIRVKPETSVASFLETIKAIPLKKGHLPVFLESLYMGTFRPSEEDINRSVSEMGLKSGTLRLFDGRED